MVSYSAVSHGKVVENVVFDKPSFSDTLQVTMQTEKAVYPVGTETITVQLTNENPKGLFFGEDYWIVRKEGQQWIYLHDNGSWTDIGYGLEKGHTLTFTARLRPLINDNRPGTYRVIKEIGFSIRGKIGIWRLNSESNSRRKMTHGKWSIRHSSFSESAILADKHSEGSPMA